MHPRKVSVKERSARCALTSHARPQIALVTVLNKLDRNQLPNRSFQRLAQLNKDSVEDQTVLNSVSLYSGLGTTLPCRAVSATTALCHQESLRSRSSLAMPQSLVTVHVDSFCVQPVWICRPVDCQIKVGCHTIFAVWPTTGSLSHQEDLQKTLHMHSSLNV